MAIQLKKSQSDVQLHGMVRDVTKRFSKSNPKVHPGSLQKAGPETVMSTIEDALHPVPGSLRERMRNSLVHMIYMRIINKRLKGLFKKSKIGKIRFGGKSRGRRRYHGAAIDEAMKDKHDKSLFDDFIKELNTSIQLRNESAEQILLLNKQITVPLVLEHATRMGLVKNAAHFKEMETYLKQDVKIPELAKIYYDDNIIQPDYREVLDQEFSAKSQLSDKGNQVLCTLVQSSHILIFMRFARENLMQMPDQHGFCHMCRGIKAMQEARSEYRPFKQLLLAQENMMTAFAQSFKNLYQEAVQDDLLENIMQIRHALLSVSVSTLRFQP